MSGGGFKVARAMLVAALATGAVWAVAALADTTFATDKDEPEVPQNYDLKKMVTGHASHGKLVHSVQVYGHYAPNLANSYAFPALTIKSKGTFGVFHVQHYSDGSSDVTHGSDVTGSATYKKVSADKIKITFSEAAINSPTRYLWRVDYRGPVSEDLSPNKGYWIHQLG